MNKDKQGFFGTTRDFAEALRGLPHAPLIGRLSAMESTPEDVLRAITIAQATGERCPNIWKVGPTTSSGTQPPPNPTSRNMGTMAKAAA